jgi:hypothetical protein
MKTFKQYTEACWTGYTAKGMKKKGNRMVPNCVPVTEDKTDALAKKHNFHMALSRSAPTEHLKKQHNKKAYEYLQKMADMKGMKIPPLKEDGMGAGAVSAGPTNAVSSGAIAGSGGKGGEPGVSKKRNPILTPMAKRLPPQ